MFLNYWRKGLIKFYIYGYIDIDEKGEEERDHSNRYIVLSENVILSSYSTCSEVFVRENLLILKHNLLFNTTSSVAISLL